MSDEGHHFRTKNDRIEVFIPHTEFFYYEHYNLVCKGTDPVVNILLPYFFNKSNLENHEIKKTVKWGVILYWYLFLLRYKIKIQLLLFHLSTETCDDPKCLKWTILKW